MYGYQMFENGVLRRYGNFDVEDPALYQTDVLRQKAVESIEATDSGTPLFLSLMFVAPHGEVETPAGRHSPTSARRRATRACSATCASRASFRGERDISDKPPYIRRLHRTNPATATRVRADFRSRRESLLAVDDAVADVVGALARTGRLDSTYILFTSDNGFFQGEHRIVKGKYLVYDAVHARAAADPRPRHRARHRLGRAGRQHRPRADAARRGRRDRGRPIDGRSILPFARDPRLRTRAARPARGARPGRHRPRRRPAHAPGPALPRDPHRPLPLRRVAGRRARALRPRPRPRRDALAPRRPPLPAAARARCTGAAAPAALRGRRLPAAGRPAGDEPPTLHPPLGRSFRHAAPPPPRRPGRCPRRPRAAGGRARPSRRADQRLPLAGHDLRRPDDADLPARRAPEPARHDPRHGLPQRPPHAARCARTPTARARASCCGGRFRGGERVTVRTESGGARDAQRRLHVPGRAASPAA